MSIFSTIGGAARRIAGTTTTVIRAGTRLVSGAKNTANTIQSAIPRNVPLSQNQQIQPGGFAAVPGNTVNCGGGWKMVNGRCQPNANPLFPTGPTAFGPPPVVTTGCPPGTAWDPGLQACLAPQSPVGSKFLADQFGEAVMGRYGAAIVPGNRVTNVAICPRGAVLGKDGFCYNRRDLRNNERAWPRGRAPLLTGGEMRAIQTASSAAKKLQRKTKQLQAMGMIKRPAVRRARAVPHD